MRREARGAWGIGRRVVRKAAKDRCVGLAAQLAYYFLLATFPALFLLVAVIGALPIDVALASGLAMLGSVAPPELVALLQRQLADIERGEHEGVLTAGIAGALWTSSVAMVAMIDALNATFDVSERRPWWRRRLVGLALTLAMGVFAATAFSLMFAGSAAGSWVAQRLGLGPAFELIWSVVRWPVTAVLLVLGIDLVYHFAPNRRTAWHWPSAGATLATAGWLGASLGFRFYVARLTDMAATYGAIGSVVVVLVWFYVSGLTILLGAELNAVRDAQPESS